MTFMNDPDYFRIAVIKKFQNVIKELFPWIPRIHSYFCQGIKLLFNDEFSTLNTNQLDINPTKSQERLVDPLYDIKVKQ